MSKSFVTAIPLGHYRKESVNINRVGKAYYEVKRGGFVTYTDRNGKSRVVDALTFERAYFQNGYNKRFF